MGFLDKTGSGAAISAGSSLLGSLFGSIAAKKAQKREFAQQEKLLNMQNDFTERMWNMQNEYNTPVNQMELYAQAGINPNTAAELITGNSEASSVQSSGAPGVNSIAGSMADLIGNSFGSIGNDIATQRLVNAQAKAQEINNEYLDEYNNLTNEGIKAANDLARSNKDYIDIQKGLKESEKKVFDETIDDLIAMKKSERESLEKAVIEAQKRIDLAEEQIKTEREAQKTQQAQQGALAAQANASNAAAEVGRAQIPGITAENKVAMFRASLADQDINPDGSAMDQLLKTFMQGNLGKAISIADEAVGKVGKGVYHGAKKVYSWFSKGEKYTEERRRAQERAKREKEAKNRYGQGKVYTNKPK